MKRAALALLFCLLAFAAEAQNVTVIGPITPGDCSQFNSTTVIKDSGVICNGSPTGAAGGVLSGTYPNPGFSSAVNSALTGTANGLLVATGAFGFTSTLGPTSAGTVAYWNGSAWVLLAGNNSGTKTLTEDASGNPSWSASGAGSVTSITQGTGLTFSTSPCTTTCTISLSTPVSSANGGTGVASPTAHSLPINEGASPQNNTGTGTLGQALISQGGSTDPAWVNGGWSLLASPSASNGATISDTSHITANYNIYRLELVGITCNTTGQQLELQVHTGGAFPATSYLGVQITAASGGSAVTNPTTFVPLSGGGEVTNTGEGLYGWIFIYNPSGTTNPKMINGFSSVFNGTVMAQTSFAGHYSGANTAIDGFQILCGTGNITGTVNISASL